ncbi:MAG: DNA polymerase III subunit alpha [Planctomycetota bacterium]|nr:DNA polymerase III subunit alpha [Planctomycetota bacterium]
MPADSPLLLSLRSWGSLLRGMEPISTLIEETARLGWRSAVVAEQVDLGTIVEATRAARSVDLKLLAAAEVDGNCGRSVVAIARDPASRKQLHSLVSGRRLSEPIATDPNPTSTSIPFDLVDEVCNAPSLLILVRDLSLARQLVEQLGPSARHRVLLEIDRLRDPIAREHRALDAADQLGLAVIASSRIGLLQPVTQPRHDLLEAVRRVSTIERVARDRIDQRDPEISPLLAPIPTPARWQQLYRDLPAALESASRIEKEASNFDHSATPTIFPPFPIAPGQTPFGLLYEQCHRGLVSRYGSITRAALERLATELQVIDSMGFVPYFLVVGDIVSEAHRLGIECAGRGSGAASIVSYALGITQVDPLAHGLRFERFLHPDRKDLPDIDIDLCWQGRDRIIDHVYQRYGKDRTAMICTRTTLQPRSAVREAARAHGLSPADVDRISRRLPHRLGGSSAPDSIPQFLRNDPVVAAIGIPATARRELLEDAQWLLGRPHHRSVHPGGICIADRPIQQIASVERAARGIIITQLDMYSIEETGLIKIDLLGNRCVSEIGTVRDLIEQRSGKRLDIAAIPERCERTARLLQSGDTLGCFQLESPAMRSLLIQMKAGNAQETIQAVALIRPGPSAGGLKDAFCRRARGLEAPDPPHPALASLLGQQRGLLLYEENLMELVALVTGQSLAAGDLLRRALARAVRSDSHAEIQRLEDQFIADAIGHGFGAGEARQLWQQLQRFGSYSFNKAHAASYGLLAWRSAWLKAHHPAEFLCALFRHHAGMYPFAAFVAEARRRGVALRLPCVECSAETFTLESDGSIRMPLTMILGSRQTSIESVFASRPFDSPEDLIRRTRIGMSELEEWILVGALDHFEIPRTRLLWRMRTRYRSLGASRGQATTGDLAGIVDEGPPLVELSPQKLLEHEIRLLGAGITAHPMQFHRDIRQRLGCISLIDVPRKAGDKVRISGIRIASRHHPSARGAMGFITLEDEHGTCEVSCFSSIWPSVRRVLLDGRGPLLVEGQVEERLGAVSVIAHRVTQLVAQQPTS